MKVRTLNARSIFLQGPLLALVLALFICPASKAQDFVRYFELQMSGSPAGWMRSTQTTDRDRITTTSDLNLTLKRGPVNIEIVMSSEFVETADGQPISMKSIQKMGSTPITTSYVFSTSDLTASTEQGGRTTTITRPLPKANWLTPAAGARFTLEKFKSGEKQIKLTTIDALSGPDPVTMTRTVGERETITIKGRLVSATRTIVDASTMPGVPSVEFINEHGETIKSETSMGGLKISMELAGPEVANAAIGEVAEMMVSTLIRPSRPIDHARTTKEAVYIVTNPNGKVPELPSAGFQTVEPIDEHSARVILDLSSPAPAPETDSTNHEFTGSSALIDATDENVKKLAQRATAKLRVVALKAHEDEAKDGGAAIVTDVTPMKRAEAIRKAVYRHIKNKSLGVGFASASETVLSREGDCTEHGVLLAATLRADGIPARVVAGIVYVDEFTGQNAVFGYHMWAQALIEIDGKPRWIDLDAALSEKDAFDATHIAMSNSSLADDQPHNSLANIAGTIGTLQIKVESTR